MFSECRDEPCVLHAFDAGGGGDCLFHAVAAGLEQMLQVDPAAAQHVLQHLVFEDFLQGKSQIVRLLRNRVADGITRWYPEDFLNLFVGFVHQQVAGQWLDSWDPADLLRQHDMDFLLEAESVEAIGANEDGRPEDILVSIQRNGFSERKVIADGFHKLAALRGDLRDIMGMPGNTHWGTATDVNLLAASLNVGFIIFSNRAMGDGEYVYGLNATRADYHWWITLYCVDNAHFQLVALQCSPHHPSRVCWSEAALPQALRRAYNRNNGTCEIGRGYSGGVV